MARKWSIVTSLAVLFASIPASGAVADSTLVVTEDTVLAADHVGNVVVAADDITLDCADFKVVGSGSGDGVNIANRSGVTVQNCKVEGFHTGIRLQFGASLNYILDNKVTGNTHWGLIVGEESTDNVVEANTASNNGLDGFAVFNSLTDGNIFRGNTARANDRYGFVLADGPARNSILESTAAHNGSDGILIISSYETSVRGNVLNNNEGSGVVLGDGSEMNFVEGNVANNNGWVGVLADGVSANLIRGNTLQNNEAAGVGLVNSSGMDVVENKLKANGSGMIVLGGFGHQILGNNSSNNDRYGFLFAGTDSNGIEANTAKNNGVWGFSFQDSNANQVSFNASNSNGTPENGPGFEFNNSSFNLVQDNEAFHNGSTGFFAFFGSEGNTFRRNSGCHNFFFDAGDESTGSGNTWYDNDFCVTEGI